MNFPILSAIVFIPLVGALFILITKGSQKNIEKNSKYVAIFSSCVNLFLSLYLWFSFDVDTSDFQFVEEKQWINGFFNFKLEYELRKINEYENVSSVLINIGGRIGNLMDITQEAINPASPQGSSISEQEKQKIFKAVSEVEEKIAKLKLSVK